MTVDLVRGMRDVAPAEYTASRYVQAVLERTMANYGYQMLDTPIIEHRDLYLRKLGEDLVGKVYEFSFGGRDLALRPEWTASVLRAYVAGMQDQPLPLRLSYAGPVFRYERPQRHTYRQFTQIGGEIIGGLPPRADAEAIALACAGLAAAGVTSYTVRIGHIGLVRELLLRFELPERTRGLLVWSLERLRAEGIEPVRERVLANLGTPPEGLELPPGLDDAQAALWLERVLAAMGIDLRTGTRSPAEVIQRLLRTLRRADEQPVVEAALAQLAQLAAISGSPAQALPALAGLFGNDSAAFRELQAILDLLAAHGVPNDRLVIDGALGRGLHYYTGLIFEIYDREGNQLCGGGRYDDLVSALGGRQPTPAVGFAYGLERVMAVATMSEPAKPATVLVAAVSDDDYPYALMVAERIRAGGRAVVLDVRGRSIKDNLRDATRRGFAAAVIVGAAEREGEYVVWRDLATRTERRIALAALGEAL
ncbi:ATP phosphoribosyltransferase regulatory subunit [Chloroflexus sp.]|uniref:ATP phosphoribosyltransferase regulatory subunit n=1 Tax=Chloroflexus sp. TaxID=1904827 RepID=UPI00298ED5EA|nr:ATP phosphoribosyltransferase regulatory subunit [Chloroflexus sp.]MDW8405985.1 ATP phosphoribosyltransferase regulatory subunit [Chloroflexus sp.]